METPKKEYLKHIPAVPAYVSQEKDVYDDFGWLKTKWRNSVSWFWRYRLLAQVTREKLNHMDAIIGSIKHDAVFQRGLLDDKYKLLNQLETRVLERNIELQQSHTIITDGRKQRNVLAQDNLKVIALLEDANGEIKDLKLTAIVKQGELIDLTTELLRTQRQLSAQKGMATKLRNRLSQDEE